MISAKLPLVAIQADGTKPPLFCVHPISGTTRCYEALAEQLGKDQPLYAFRSRGFDEDEEPRASIEQMAEAYRAALRSSGVTGPHQLLGWAFGCVVAFEMARQLVASGEQVTKLILMDGRAPSPNMLARAAFDPNDEPKFARMFVQHCARVAMKDPALPPEAFAQHRATLPRHVRELLLEHTLIDPAVGETQVAQRLRVFKANLIAMLSYAPQPYPGQITFFKSSEELPDHPRPASYGWEEYARLIEYATVPGNHFTLPHPAHVAGLRLQIQRALST